MRARAHVSVVATFAAAACLGCLGAGSDDGGVTISRLSCSGCDIVAESIAFVGHPEDAPISRYTTPDVDSRGRFYLTAPEVVSGITIYGSDGRWLRTLGWLEGYPSLREGVARVTIGPHDSIFASSRDSTSVLSPAYEQVRAMATYSYNSYSSSLTSNLLLRFMGDMRSDAFLADGRLVVPQRGNSFRLRQPDGSEGDAVVLEGADSVRCGSCSRVFRPGLDSGTVWSSAPDRYVLEQHQVDGTLLRRITRRAEWFETAPPDSVARRTEGEEELLDLTSRSQFASVTQTADGLLWTLSYVNNPADPLGIDFIRAITAIASQSSGSLGQMPAPEDLLSHFVTRVEVIDPATNELLASETFPGLLRALRRDLVAEFTWNAQGGPAWKVYRLSLTGR